MEEKLEALKNRIPAMAGNLIMLPRLLNLLLALFRDPRIPRWMKLMTGAMVGYVALPFDFIPDFVPIVGKGDDMVVVFLVLIYFMKFCPPDVVREHWHTTMGQDYDMEQSLRQALVELEPIVGAKYEYFRENIGKLMQKFSREEQSANSQAAHDMNA